MTSNKKFKKYAYHEIQRLSRVGAVVTSELERLLSAGYTDTRVVSIPAHSISRVYLVEANKLTLEYRDAVVSESPISDFGLEQIREILYYIGSQIDSLTRRVSRIEDD